MRRLFLLLLTVCISSMSYGQLTYFEPGFNVGRYTPFSAKHKYISNYQQYRLDVRVGFQPNYGLLMGYTHNTLDSVVYYTHEGNQYGPIGECFSLAGFVEGPIYRCRNWSLNYDIIYGADLWTHHGNEMLGSVLNFHVSFDVGPTIKLSERFDLAIRFLYYHSSNGATFLPDNGVNSHLVRLALRYYPHERPTVVNNDTIPFSKHNNLFISEGLGWLQTYTRLEGQLPNETPFFVGNTLRFGFSRQFHPRFRWDVAIDLLWTGETRYCHQLEGVPYNFWNSTHMALSADFEVQFGRFAFYAGGAYYLYHGSTILPDFYTPYYERVGYKMYVGKNHNYFIGTFMKIHLNSIDYIEWTFGMNLF